MLSLTTRVLWTLLLLSYAVLNSSAPAQPVPLLLGIWQHQPLPAVILTPGTTQKMATPYDEGLEETEEGTEGLEDYIEASFYNETEETDDGKYVHELHENEGKYIPELHGSEGKYIPELYENNANHDGGLSQGQVAIDSSNHKLFGEVGETKDENLNTVSESDIDQVTNDGSGHISRMHMSMCNDKQKSENNDRLCITDAHNSEVNEGKSAPDKQHSQEHQYDNEQESEHKDGKYLEAEADEGKYVSDENESTTILNIQETTENDEGKYIPDNNENTTIQNTLEYENDDAKYVTFKEPGDEEGKNEGDPQENEGSENKNEESTESEPKEKLVSGNNSTISPCRIQTEN